MQNIFEGVRGEGSWFIHRLEQKVDKSIFNQRLVFGIELAHKNLSELFGIGTSFHGKFDLLPHLLGYLDTIDFSSLDDVQKIIFSQLVEDILN